MKDRLIEFIAQKLLLGNSELNISADDDLLGSGLIDSLGIVRLVAFIEMEFNVQIPSHDLIIENFMSVEAIVNYLQQKTK